LELRTSRPGCVGQSCHPAALSEAAPVEDDLRHAGSLRPLSAEPADLLGGVAVTAGGALPTLLDGAGRGKGATADVVDDLGADVLVRPKHGEARTIGGTGHVLAHTAVTANAKELLLLRCHFAAFPALRWTTSPA